jgi:hypothetical protein
MAISLSTVAGAAAQFFDNSGVPLSGGLLYTYAAGTTTPLTTYTSNTGLAINTNPIVLNSAGRVPYEIWLTIGSSYKFVLSDSNNVQIASYDNLTGSLNANTLANTSDIALGDALVGFRQSDTSGLLTGSIGSTVHNKLQESISVLDFIEPSLHAAIAGGSYTNDLSGQIQAAFNIGKPILFPAGTYYFNVIATSQFILTGQGSVNTFIKPYDSTRAAINYKLSGGGVQWSYNTIIRSVCFQGTSGTLTTGGVGFTYGNTDPTVYDTNDSFIGFVTFENCRFLSLYKGIQRPSGNLALQITNCNFASCYYGTYNVQGKGFPPGQFFILNGESNSCLCAHYFDVQQEGLGQISFDNHVFEANSICVRAWQPLASVLYTPFMFRNCWNEVNGLYRPGGPSTVTLDVWNGTGTGAVVTTQSTSCTYPYLMQINQIVWDGGFCAGFSLLGGTGCLMKINNARVECTAGTNSSPFYIDPTDTQACILIENCVTTDGFPQIYNCIDYDRNRCLNTGLTASGSRARFLQQMWNISTGTNQIGFNQTFQTAQTWSTGSTGVIATGSIVTGNGIYSSVNNFAYTSPTGIQVYYFSNTQVTLGAGYYVVTFQMLAVNLGSIDFNVWNVTTTPVIVSLRPIADSNWHTYGGISYSNSGLTVNLGATSNDPTGLSINFSISAYQIKRFSSLVQAEDFLYSRTYLA